MKVYANRTMGTILVELTVPETRFFLEELEHLRGGARLPKVRQFCTEVRTVLTAEKSEDWKGK